MAPDDSKNNIGVPLSNPKCYLLELPPELRNEIYELVLHIKRISESDHLLPCQRSHLQKLPPTASSSAVYFTTVEGRGPTHLLRSQRPQVSSCQHSTGQSIPAENGLWLSGEDDSDHKEISSRCGLQSLNGRSRFKSAQVRCAYRQESSSVY